MRRYKRIAEAYGTAFEILFSSIVLRNGAPQTSIYLLYGFSEKKYTKYGSVSAGFSLAAAGTADERQKTAAKIKEESDINSFFIIFSSQKRFGKAINGTK